MYNISFDSCNILQVQRSIENGRKGQYLPLDFKFSASGMKVHSQKLWAYSVSGILFINIIYNLLSY